MSIEIKAIMENDYRTADQSKITSSMLHHRHDFNYDANAYATRHKFNGKELDEETGPKSST